MSTIYKYPLQPGNNEIMAPAGARLLAVQMQNGTPCLWALVDPTQPPRRIVLSIYGTGHGMPDAPGQYVGTFQMECGALVWHLFETARERSL